MELSEKDICLQLKTLYGFENLHFYRDPTGFLRCAFISDPYNFDSEDLSDLKFVLFYLSQQQGSIFFDDICENCSAKDLRTNYLIMKLSHI